MKRGRFYISSLKFFIFRLKNFFLYWMKNQCTCSTFELQYCKSQVNNFSLAHQQNILAFRTANAECLNPWSKIMSMLGRRSNVQSIRLIIFRPEIRCRTPTMHYKSPSFIPQKKHSHIPSFQALDHPSIWIGIGEIFTIRLIFVLF